MWPSCLASARRVSSVCSIMVTQSSIFGSTTRQGRVTPSHTPPQLHTQDSTVVMFSGSSATVRSSVSCITAGSLWFSHASSRTGKSVPIFRCAASR